MLNPSEALAREISATLRNQGYPAFLVGGCVRDRLMGRSVKDYDVVTRATPDQIKRLFPQALEVGAHFGVMLVRDGVAQVEVATFRSDHSYRDGRHPDAVTFETDPRRDALRRDFTINALYEDPLTGEIIDYVNGRADLQAGVIRAIGDPALRFAEDHLRMLRAVRFAARLQFSIEPRTAAAIRDRAASINTISAERIRDEIGMILTEGHARRGFELLSSAGLLQHILPEIGAMRGVPQPPQFHPEGDVWTHTMLILEALPAGVAIELALAALLHDVAKPVTLTVTDRIRFNGHAERGAAMVRDILARLKFPNAVIDSVSALVKDHMRFIDLPRMKTAARKRFFRLPHFDRQLELYRLDLLGSYRPIDAYLDARRQRDSFAEEELRPLPLLNGEDLIELGYTPGPEFRHILDALEDAQLDGVIRTRDEALRFLAARFDRG